MSLSKIAQPSASGCFQLADSAAQTMTMFWNFIAILILPTTIFLLRFANKLEHIGDILNYVAKIFPQQSLGAVIFFENAGELLAQWREMSEGTGKTLMATNGHGRTILLI